MPAANREYDLRALILAIDRYKLGEGSWDDIVVCIDQIAVSYPELALR